MYDLIISGGIVVDGTGDEPRIADVGVIGETIAAVGDLSGAEAERRIDASGLLVTPGWVDIHTHYDGQVTWDSELAPTAWHGVTTIVTGNCGVGFAPAHPDKHDWLIGLMEGVEDIPGTALAEGITWEWETFPEYLDALEPRRWPMDVGTQISHGAVRAYVMGDRGARNEPATSQDISEMSAIVKEAIAAGALGFSTSRTLAHRAIDGEPVPGTFAAEDELFGIGAALGELDAGVFELAPAGTAGDDMVAAVKEMDWMRKLSATIKRPVSFALLQIDPAPEHWRDMMDASLEAVAEGADLWPQVAGRPTGVLTGHHVTYCLFDQIPAYAELKARDLPPAEFYQVLLDPNVREAIISFSPEDPDVAAAFAGAYAKTFILGDPPDYEPGPESSLAGRSELTGESPLAIAYDAMLDDQGWGLLYIPILNYSDGDLEPTLAMLQHPRAAIGLADGGAHVGTICDASMPTFMLTHWVRDRTRGDRLPLEFIVSKQTRETARLYGLNDRGVLAAGMLADLNLIDFDALAIEPPVVIDDLPAGGRRLIQRSRGYVATIKCGEVTYADGVATGALPGRLLRGAKARPMAPSA
ncbi:MAG: amidohydrolase family protein [Actinomycetes bacterium]